MNETINMEGHLTLQLTDLAARLVHEQRRHNLIVKSGRDLVAKLFAGVAGGAPPTRVTHMAVGTNATLAVDSQTALLGERPSRKEILPADVVYTEYAEPVTGGGPVAGTSGPADTTRVGGAVGGPIPIVAPALPVVRRVRVTLKTVFDFNEANGTDPLREAGIFNAATGGVMYNRVVFDPVSKTNAFKLTLIWDITF